MNKKTLTYIGIGAVVLVGGYLAYKKFFKDDKPSKDAEHLNQKWINKKH